MNDKMVRFLNSIKIYNVDDFDLDFEFVGYNRFDRKQLDMVIVKRTPWKYDLLEQFQNGLNTITYKYLLRFSYLVRPNNKDVEHLFEDWYQTIYRIPHNLNLWAEEDSKIYIEYVDSAEKEQYRSAIEDFKSFLEFLNYEFVIIESFKPTEEEEVVISEKKMKKLVKEANKAIEEAEGEEPIIAEEANDASTAKELIEKEKELLNQTIGDVLLEHRK